MEVYLCRLRQKDAEKQSCLYDLSRDSWCGSGVDDALTAGDEGKHWAAQGGAGDPAAWGLLLPGGTMVWFSIGGYKDGL